MQLMIDMLAFAAASPEILPQSLGNTQTPR
jgi:hypothetical protein